MVPSNIMKSPRFLGMCTRDELLVEIPLASIPLSGSRSDLDHFQRHQAQGRHKPVILVSCSYDRDAPTNVGAKHTPSLVLILCRVFV